MEKRLIASDLYNYLVSFASLLEKLGEQEPAERVLQVSRFASGSTSEFYGEASLLLPQLLTLSKLSEGDRARLQGVIAGIRREFERIGGG
jgi:hypothetical protein